MPEKEPIKVGEVYWVQADKARFKVRTLRPTTIPGWWHCEGVDTGDPLVIPEEKMEPVDD